MLYYSRIKKFVNKIKEDKILEIIETIKLLEKEELIEDNYILNSGITSFWRLLFENLLVSRIEPKSEWHEFLSGFKDADFQFQVQIVAWLQ